ncbi:MAG: rRNA biogenesis protein rrp5 [Cirrosporium novae-zelandiae]|nr:MAG: rRNA biogenesis protein rrp5 [Cirrosporium novae-zelandiae]
MAPVKRKEAPVDAQSKPKKSKIENHGKSHNKKKDNSATDDSANRPAKENTKQPKSTASAPRQSQLTLLKDDEPSFPRGGGSVLTPLEKKQIQIQAKKDVLFEEKGLKRKTDNLEDTDEEADGVEAEDEENLTKIPPKSRLKKNKSITASEQKEAGIRIEGLSYKRIIPGSIILGQVASINDNDITVTLPNNLIGFVPITAISEKLNQKLQALADEEMDIEKEEENDEDENDDLNLKSLFSVGQYLRAYVTSTNEDSGGKNRKHIELSLLPIQANSGLSKSDLVPHNILQASVISIEEHGLVMDIGVGGTSIKGFMSSRELGEGRDYKTIKEGAVFLCLITGLSSNGNIVKLSADLQRAGNIKRNHFLTDAPTINAFLPGTAVEVLLSEVTSSGLAGKIMGMLDVTADIIHSGAVSEKDLGKKYKPGMKVKSRIICTFPTSSTRKLGISLLKNVVHFLPSSNQDEQEPHPLKTLPLSSAVSEAKVVKVEPNIGLFVNVGVKDNLGFVHISRVSDDIIETLSEATGKYKVGSVHQARVTGYNSVDRLFLLSMEQKIIDQPFLRIEDVKVGENVKCKVEKLIINPAGGSEALIRLADGISGLVSEIHLADIHLQHPERKFREGTSVSARVLLVDVSKRRIRLTLKKSLVNSDAPVWSSYDNISPGDSSPGTLIKIQSNGAVVQFYGHVRGFLPVSEMSEAYIADPKQHFRVGQVVDVHVLSVNPEEGRMVVSCKDPSLFGEEQKAAFNDLTPGDIVSGTVTELNSDDVVLDLANSIKARLPIDHLTDGSEQKNASLMKKIRVGQTLQDLVILEKQETRKLVFLSDKPSLVSAAKEGKLLRSLDDVQEGAEVKGFVHNITPEGVFVRFASRLTGLLWKNQIPMEALDLPAFGLRRFQSISARVQRIDYSQERFYLTQKGKVEEVDSKVPERPATNPVDGVSMSLNDFVLGKLTKAKITSVKNTQLNMELADGVQGRVDVSEVFDSWDNIKDPKQPLRQYKKGDILSVRIIGLHDSRNHKFLPITHRSTKQPVLELTAKPSKQKGTKYDLLSLDQMEIGSSWVAFVNNINADCVWVNLSPSIRGRIRLMEISDDLSLLEDLGTNFPIGSALKVEVTGVNHEQGKLDLSARSQKTSTRVTLDSLSQGMVLHGRVTKTMERQVIVQLGDGLSGTVSLLELDDNYDNAKPSNYTRNQMVRVCITSVDIPNKRVSLSMRPSKVLSSSLPIKDPVVTSAERLKVGNVVRGFVKHVANNGLFVTLGNDVTGYVRITDLSDSFIKDWKNNFQVDQLVKGKIISLDPLLNHIQMTLKESILNDENYVPPLTFHDMKVGQIITGKVRKVGDFGVFIVVDGSANVSGLCHQSEMAEERVADVKKLYSEGDAVKAVVLKIELEKRRISFGLKASYFVEREQDADSKADQKMEDAPEDKDDLMKQDEESEDSSDGGAGVADIEMEDDDDEESDDSDDSDDDDNNSSDEENPRPLKTNGLSTGGFDWTGGIADNEDQGAQSEPEIQSKSSQRKARKRAEENDVDKTGDLDTQGPKSIADFERHLIGEPNNSELWIDYMAFQLGLGEMDKAREISERALQTINITATEVKFDIWVARLNLEAEYGTDETVEEVFERACQYNDAQKIYEALISSFIRSYNTSGKTDTNKLKKVKELYQALVKKFSQDPEVWTNYACFLMDTLAEPDQARALLPRAIQALPKFLQVKVTCNFARLEFRSPNGDAERGRTLFEGLLDTFPKKLDLWNALLDQEMAKGDKEQIRQVFGRATSKKLKAKQAKHFFDRWLKFEEKQGDTKSVENVKARAQEYVRELQANQ